MNCNIIAEADPPKGQLLFFLTGEKYRLGEVRDGRSTGWEKYRVGQCPWSVRSYDRMIYAFHGAPPSHLGNSSKLDCIRFVVGYLLSAVATSTAQATLNLPLMPRNPISSFLFPFAAIPETWRHVLHPSGHDEIGRRSGVWS